MSLIIQKWFDNDLSASTGGGTNAITGISISGSNAFGSATQSAVLSGQSITGSVSFDLGLDSDAASGQSIATTAVFGNGSLTANLTGTSIIGVVAFGSATQSGSISGQSVSNVTAYASGLMSATLNGQSITGAIIYGDLEPLTNGAMFGMSIASTVAFGQGLQAAALSGQSISGSATSALAGNTGSLSGQSISNAAMYGDLQALAAGAMFGISTIGTVVYGAGILTVADDDPGGDVPRRRKTRNVIRDGKFVQEKIQYWPFEQTAAAQQASIVQPNVLSQPSVQITNDGHIVTAIAVLMMELL